MKLVCAFGGLALILLILVEGFETMVLPRRVSRRYRLAVFYYRNAWRCWRLIAGWLPSGRRRQSFLGVFGPLSLLGLMLVWVVGLVLGFALLHWALDTAIHSPDETPTFVTYFYLSGVTFSTLGFGDVVPVEPVGRVLTVVEAGMGFGFMAVIIGYLPTIYQAFSRREVTISLLDARAGSPPSAAQLLLRVTRARHVAALQSFLAEWERWAAEVLESHLSFPVLSYYRSQHDNQSWLAALTTILDACALLLAGGRELDTYQAQLTFAMARHAVVDLAMVFTSPPREPDACRFPDAKLPRLREVLREAGMLLHEGPVMDARLTELRAMYEPFVHGLAHYFLLALPPVFPEKTVVDNWQTSAWMRRVAGFGKLPADVVDDHFD